MYTIDDEVVISGVGGYFPKSLNIEEFRDNLFKNETLMDTRWRYGERGVTNVIGKIPTEYFDNAYFGIHRQQSTFMDPMQRLILERTFEALIDAGVNPSEIRGKRVGVFMGSSVGENDNLFLESVISGFGVTGHSRAMMPNRVSYWLNLKGPSVSYDSNWVSGIEVLRLAYEAVKTGQCESVIVGTANLALNSEFQWLYNDMGLLSSDGSTKAFDVNAEGYGRSDGVVVMYIQRASQAKRSYATILNVATCFNGNREGTLLDIDVPSMVEFIQEFYTKVDVDPTDVEFIEAYGCALKETDRKELDAIHQVYCGKNGEQKKRKTPLLVGAVKTNTGHSEASSSLFSVVKVLIAMETECIPATLQFENANPEIGALTSGDIEVVTENRKWKGEYAAVNAIGLDSYYGHILLRSNPKKKTLKYDNVPRLVLASTRTEEGIKEIIDIIKSKPEIDPEYYKLIQDLFSKPILGHLYRGYALTGIEEVKQETEYHLGNKRQIWFVYSGMGSQWNGMLGDLMQIPVFAKSINRCCEVLKPKGVDLMHILTDKDPTIFDLILNSFVGIAAFQIALTDVLHAIGIVPDGIIGHSVGELGCAYGDGCLSLEQMMLCSYSRGLASIETKLIKGMMAAVGLGYNQIKDKLPPTIEVACHNGPDSSTISGPTEDMEKFVKELQDQGIFAKLVNVANIAYHSRYIKPAAPRLLTYLKEILPEPAERSSKWISTSNAENDWDTPLARHSSAEYHTNNLLSSVLFEEGLKHIPKDSVLIEIAPHGLLQAILKRSLKSGCTNVPLTQRGFRSGVEFLLTALGKLYLAGLNMDVSPLFGRVDYPVGKGTGSLAPLVKWEHSEMWRTGLEDKLKSLFGVRDFQVTLNSEEFRDTVGHQLDDKIILPVSSYLNIIFNIIANISTGHKELIFENLHFKKSLVIPKIGSVAVHSMIQKGSGDFEILAANEIVVTGRMRFPEPTDKILIDAKPIEIPENNNVINNLTAQDVYNELQHRGHKYSGEYRSIKDLNIGEKGSIATVQWNGKWALFLEGMIQQHLLQEGERSQEIFVPKTIQKIVISQTLLPEDKTELKSTYNYATGLISTDGIQIVGLRATPYQKDAKPISFDSVEFTPLINTNNSNSIESVINVALQLTLDNFTEQFVTNFIVTEVETENPSLSESIKEVIGQYATLNPSLTSVKESKQIIVQNSYPLLIVLNDTVKEDIVKVISTSHGFLLARNDDSKHIAEQYPQITEIAQITTTGHLKYSVFRRVKSSVPSVILVKGDSLSVKDVTRASPAGWVSQLETAADIAKSKNHSVFLVSNLVPVEGFRNFTQELLTNSQLSAVRVLFTLDKRPQDVDLRDPKIQQIFRNDLHLTVIKNGVTGTIIPVPIKFKTNINNNLNVTSNAIKDHIISHIGVNPLDETILISGQVKNDIGNLDYSATSTTNSGTGGRGGQRVMGVAQLDRDLCKLMPDAVLKWEVPEYWTLEDAATVPQAYASAYYCLIQKASLKPGETVLIQAGCTAIGLAAISIASNHGCTVYTTVATDRQKAYLKKQFSCIRDRNILSSETTNFEPLLLMSTGGLGANVIINCLSGNLLQAAVGCLADFGRFIQIGKFDLQENNTIGMSIFLRNTSFYVVNLENICTAPVEVKEELRGLVQDGIDKLTVRPLMRETFNHQNIDNILSNLKAKDKIGKNLLKIDHNLTLNRFKVDKPLQFVCDPRQSYLVHGGNTDQSLDTIEWLVVRGARRILVTGTTSNSTNETQTQPLTVQNNRRLALLKNYYTADVIFSQKYKNISSRDSASELLTELYNSLGPIHTVLVLPSNNTTNSVAGLVYYLENALRNIAPKAIFVNFNGNAAGVLLQRSDVGHITYNVQWDDKTLNFTDTLDGLDEILSYKVDNLLVKSDKISDSNQETTQALFKKLASILPTNVDEFTLQQRKAPQLPDLVQLPTIGPRDIRELAPVFVIPGVTGLKETHEMAFQLLYPTYCAVLPAKPLSIKETAAILVEKIRKIWPKGAYNIIGVSWGGALTVEIARILDKLGASLHLYFIDGAPSTIQASLKHLGESAVNLETNLLTRVLKLNDTDVIRAISSAASWQDRVKLALDSYESPITHREKLAEGLGTLKSRLVDIVEYEPSDELVSGQIHLIRPVGSSKYDNCGLVSYCKQTPQITLVNGDHITMINNPLTSEYINEKHYLI